MRRLSVALLALCVALAACGSDPSIAIIDPPDGAQIAGAVRLVADIKDGDADALTFYVDEVAPSRAIGERGPNAEGRFEQPWFSADEGNGEHTLFAVATVDGKRLEARAIVTVANVSRADAIPASAVKMTPALDAHPPMVEAAFTSMFDACEPLPAPVNTAGAEDAPYITADGQELYFFFTPDASVPPDQQLVDGVTGIYRSVRDGDDWGEPERVHLSYQGEVALDGCETIYGDELWFCTARAGVERSIDIYRAHRDGEHWVEWESVGSRLNIELQVGEMHLANGGNRLYYHTERSGGQGGIDIWLTEREGDGWSDAVNLGTVNTEYTDGWPWVSEDEMELWLTHGPAAPEVWRSLNSGGQWQTPEKVVAPFAGEATFDENGDLYFTHHFWDDGSNSIIEADIYRCPRK